MRPVRTPRWDRHALADPRAWPRPARRGAAAVLAVAVAWVLAHTVANRAAALERLRERAAGALRQRLGEVQLGPEVSVDWLFRATVGPVALPASTPGAPPVVRVERVKVRASFPALLSGRVEPASVKLFDVELTPGPGGRELEALVERVRGRRRARPATGATPPAEAPPGADPVLHLRRLTVILPGDRRVGPLDARLARQRDGGEEVLTATLSLGGGGRAEAVLRRRAGVEASAAAKATARSTPTAPLPAWSLAFDLHAGPSDLPAFLRALPVEPTRGDLSLHAEAAATPAGAALAVRGALAGLTLRGEPLGAEPIGPVDLGGEAELAWRQEDWTLLVTRAVLRPVGPLAVEVAGRVSATGDRPFDLAVRVPPVGYRSLVEALPAPLAPGPEAPRPPGEFGAAVSVSGSLRRPAEWAVTGGLDLAGLREASRQGPPSALRAPFTARPGGDDGPAILVGPANPDFVPFADLPEHVVRAVTTSEDAGFFGHAGFDLDELKNAAVAGAAAGKLLRGGSTITQQLAKNLFLSRDRTLARKAREALIAVALEGTLPKARLLEIYLNVIEWGPGLHGLGPAARHYFGVDARALTPRQACFLAAIIPSPLRSHAAVAAGRPASLWANRVDTLLLKLQQAGVLTEDQLLESLAEPLAFAGAPPQAAGSAAEPDDAPPGEQGEPPLGDLPGAPPDPASGG